jgi:sugar phosphate isomerase/epimerase
MIHRRKFLQLSGTALSGAIAYQLTGCSTTSSTSTENTEAKRGWGVQLFSIPQMVANDFPGTLDALEEFGYREIEFFGPYAFSSQATIDGWVPIAKQLGITQNAFYGYEMSVVKEMLAEHGLSSPSAHLDIATMRTNMAPAMKALSSLGVKYVVIPALRGETLNTADDYKRMADEFNSFGKQMKEFGISFVYHNHGYEHAVKDGHVPMDILITSTDPELVKFELDIFWMQAAGASPVEYLQKYPGRYKLMHVKDAAEKVRFTGDGNTAEEWMALFPKMADPGTGVFNIKEIVEAGAQSGVEHFFLERDLAPDPITTLKNSYQYLSTI